MRRESPVTEKEPNTAGCLLLIAGGTAAGMFLVWLWLWPISHHSVMADYGYGAEPLEAENTPP